MPHVNSVAKTKHAAGARTAIANAIAVARDVVGESIITIIDAVAIVQRVVDRCAMLDGAIRNGRIGDWILSRGILSRVNT